MSDEDDISLNLNFDTLSLNDAFALFEESVAASREGEEEDKVEDEDEQDDHDRKAKALSRLKRCFAVDSKDKAEDAEHHEALNQSLLFVARTRSPAAGTLALALLRLGANANHEHVIRYPPYSTPQYRQCVLAVALKARNSAVVSALLQHAKALDLSARTERGKSLLAVAASRDWPSAGAAILSVASARGYVVDFGAEAWHDVNGYSLLHECAQHNASAFAQWLFEINDKEKSSTANVTTSFEATSSFEATDCRTTVSIDLNGLTRSKMTPMCLCAQFGSLDVAKLLVSRFANKLRVPNLALHLAVSNAIKGADLARLLVDSNLVDVNWRNESEVGRSVLHSAVDARSVDAVKYLLTEIGFDPNCRDRRDETPLMRAVDTMAYDIVELLLRCGADVNARDFVGANALDKATQTMTSWANNEDVWRIVSLLLAHGVEIHFVHNSSPWHSAMSQLLSAAHYFDASLFMLTTVRVFLEHRPDLLAWRFGSNTMLHLAALHESSGDLGAFLLLNGASGQLGATNEKDLTPLATAKAVGHAHIQHTLEAFVANRIAFRNRRSPLIPVAIGLAHLQLPVLCTVEIAAWSVANNDRLFAAHSPINAWAIAKLIKDFALKYNS